jgi:hypothetical protein
MTVDIRAGIPKIGNCLVGMSKEKSVKIREI